MFDNGEQCRADGICRNDPIKAYRSIPRFIDGLSGTTAMGTPIGGVEDGIDQ